MVLQSLTAHGHKPLDPIYTQLPEDQEAARRYFSSWRTCCGVFP